MKFFKRYKNILYLLLFALILRIPLSFFGTLELDQNTFIAWSSDLAKNGFKNFYNGWSDYLPGYLYFLWGLGKVNLLNIFPEVLLYKIPGILADLATGFLIYEIIKKYKNEKWGLIAAAIYVFNPAIIANSTFWGQVDSLTSLASIAAVYLLSRNYVLSAAVLAAGTLIKPQAAFIMPIIFILMLKEKWKFSKILIYLTSGLIVFILGFVPFAKGDLIPFVLDRLTLSANQYPYTSVNAFNFWGLFGFWRPDNIYLQFGGYLVVLLTTVLFSLKYAKKKLAVYYLLTFVFAASFMYFTRMHERHLLPLLAPLAIVSVDNPALLLVYLGYSLIYFANLVYSYFWISNNFIQVFPDFFIKLLIFLNNSFLIYITYVILKDKKVSWKRFSSIFILLAKKIKSRKTRVVKLPDLKLNKNTIKAILFLILGFAFVTRVFDLSKPDTMYFDEVYHAFTAKVMMGPESYKAWEWWNTPPEGYAYEWTHPPLAKLGMVLGMSIFGQTSFGYRIPGAILGVGAVFLVYLIARHIFKDEAIGLMAAAAFSLDGLALVMSRIGMNDSYILFFSLLSIYMFMKEKDLFSATSFGLAISSKWSAVWAIPIFFVLWLKRKNKFKPSIFWFVLLPPVIYLLSYLPMFATGHTLSTWWGMQQQMWWYHTRLEATHPYTSQWWTWPLLIRPIYLYTSNEIGGMVSRIYAMGNPFVFWFGLLSVIASAAYAAIEKNKSLGLVVFSYLIFFAAWAASPRIMFLYHYLPSVPFMAIATAYVLRRNSKLVPLYFGLCFLAFVYFYPHFIGLNIPLALDRSYYWLSTWR
ncbi:MAG: dolichyl-phosphate-mannose-protein mannosyltransferase family protein [uncultured bacterium]|nr:MAG: dolichyl-phosphate-mannose-protein mannosyltransferase family protein [uncultured bacterium]